MLVELETWNLTLPVIPPRSRCYRLTPVGLGTPYAECLTSYLARLANAHGVSLSTLVVHGLRPVSPQGWLVARRSSGSVPWDAVAVALNGTEVIARNWCTALETLTMRKDLRFLTLLTWAKVLHRNGLLRQTRAYCPECYEEWRAGGGVVYEPLLWNIALVAGCILHRRRLRLACCVGSCSRTMSLLGSRFRPGYCPRCHGWLGVSSNAAPDPKDILQGAELNECEWITTCIGELIASAPTLSAPPTRQSLATSLGGYAAPLAYGLSTAQPALPHLATLHLWLRGRAAPEMRSLLKLCDALETSPLRLFTGDRSAASTSVRLDARRVFTPRKRRKVDHDLLRTTLATILASDDIPPPSMRQVANSLGHLPPYLRSRFPDLSKAISVRFAAHRRSMKKRQ